MAQSFQHEKPPARINLFLEVAKGDASEKVELPMRLLVMGDFTNREDDTPLEEREVINLNKDNFEDILRSQEISVKTVVKNTLTDDDDLPIELKFDSMKSFNPETVALQVPEVARLLAARNLLQDLRNRLISAADFRKQIESVIKDDAAREKLLAELGAVVSDDTAAGDGDDAGDDA